MKEMAKKTCFVPRSVMENLEDGNEKLLADNNPTGDENSFFLAGGDEVILLLVSF